MQFIETSDLGVRSAVYRLCRSPSDLEFILFPMLHVGSRSFYAEVRRRLEACDTVLVEGVNSKRLVLLFRAYQAADKRRGGNLVSQARGLDFTGLTVKLVSADVPGAEFDKRWDKLPLGERLFSMLAVPVLLAYVLRVAEAEWVTVIEY